MKRGVYRGGSGPPVVLLHSGFSTWAEWRSMNALLTPARDVLAPTLPGSDGGEPLDLPTRSMLTAHADHVEEILDRTGWIEPVQMVGSSFGGVAALELAARGRASSVIALAPPWVAGLGVPYWCALFSTMFPWLRITERLHARMAANPRVVSLIFHGSRSPAAITAEDAAAIWRSWGRFPWFRAVSGLGSGQLGPGMPDLERVEAPVTLVWGTADRILPRWMRRRWERVLPEARVETLPGFPHIPHLRDPKRIAALVLRG
jgi:pimeloyl-ACP methyl ester carboxylesterase